MKECWATVKRQSVGFDMRKHVADAARVGIQALEVKLLADAVPIQVRERRVYEDKYQWWCIYSPGLDAGLPLAGLDGGETHAPLGLAVGNDGLALASEILVQEFEWQQKTHTLRLAPWAMRLVR